MNVQENGFLSLNDVSFSFDESDTKQKVEQQTASATPVKQEISKKDLYRLLLLSTVLSNPISTTNEVACKWFQEKVKACQTEAEAKNADDTALKARALEVISSKVGIQNASKIERQLIRFGRMFKHFTVEKDGVHYNEVGNKERLCSLAIFVEVIRKGIEFQVKSADIKTGEVCVAPEIVQNGQNPPKVINHRFYYVLGPKRMHIFSHTSLVRLEDGDGSTATVRQCLELTSSKIRALKMVTIISQKGMSQNKVNDILEADRVKENAFLEQLQKLCDANGNPYFQRPNYAHFRIAGETPKQEFIASLQHIYPEGNLENWIKRNNPTFTQRIEFAKFLYEAVSAMHEAGVVHRDINPRNIFVEMHKGKPRLCIADFGSASKNQDIEQWLKTIDDVRHACNFDFACQATFDKLQQLADDLKKNKQVPPDLAVKLMQSYDLQAVSLVVYELFTEKVPFDVECVHAFNSLHRAPKRGLAFSRDPFKGLPYSDTIVNLLAKHCDRNPDKRDDYSAKKIIAALDDFAKKNRSSLNKQFPR